MRRHSHCQLVPLATAKLATTSLKVSLFLISILDKLEVRRVSGGSQSARN